MVRFLILNGADVAIVDVDGRLAMQLAKEDTLLIFMETVLNTRQKIEAVKIDLGEVIQQKKKKLVPS